MDHVHILFSCFDTLTFQVLAGFLYHSKYLPPEDIQKLLRVKKTESIAPTQTDDSELSNRLTPDQLGNLAEKTEPSKMKMIASLIGIDSSTISHVLTDSEDSWLFNFSILTMWTYRSTDNDRRVKSFVFKIKFSRCTFVVYSLIMQEQFYSVTNLSKYFNLHDILKKIWIKLPLMVEIFHNSFV